MSHAVNIGMKKLLSDGHSAAVGAAFRDALAHQWKNGFGREEKTNS